MNTLKTDSINIGTGTLTSFNQQVTNQAILPENIVSIVKKDLLQVNSLVRHLG